MSTKVVQDPRAQTLPSNTEDKCANSHTSLRLGSDNSKRESPAIASSSLLDDTRFSSRRSQVPTPLLRKSSSVDSFITSRNSAQKVTIGGGEQHGGSTETAFSKRNTAQQILSSPPSSMSLTELLRSKVGRRRRRAGNFTDNEVSTQDESEFDRTGSTSKVKGRVRARLFSLKGSKSGSATERSEQQSDVIPPTPSRVQEHGASTSFSSLKATDLPTPAISPKSSSTSQALPIPTPELKKRSRSHSVGASSRSTAAKIAKRLSVGTPSVKPEMTREVSIAVVGPNGCGKSTFIRKILKRYETLNADTHSVSVVVGDMKRSITCNFRRVRHTSDNKTVTILNVYEYNSLDWRLEGSQTPPSWPEGLASVDGVFVCYDASNSPSFQHVTQLLAFYHSMALPTLVLACKSDLDKQISPEDAVRAVDQYSKVVEVSQYTEDGKARMRKAADVLVRRILALRSERSFKMPSIAQNMPTPQTSRSTMSTAASEFNDRTQIVSVASSTNANTRTPSTPALTGNASPDVQTVAPRSPSRVRSLNDILTDHEKRLAVTTTRFESDHEPSRLANVATESQNPPKGNESPPCKVMMSREGDPESANYVIRQRIRHFASHWVTIDELLERLCFLAVSGDDPSFIDHFFLTYRRFATPRSILLGLQKRMNELRNMTEDIPLACFAQLRICCLLEQWTRDYPSDFAVPGTQGALNAFIRHLLNNAHTLLYGSNFLPFLDALPSLTDEDAAWAIKSDDFIAAESDAESVLDGECASAETQDDSLVSAPSLESRVSISDRTGTSRSSGRERRSSLPLSAMMLIKTPLLSSCKQQYEAASEPTMRNIIMGLQKASAAVSQYEPDAIANEITRRDLELFLKIERRDWLRHTLISGKKDPVRDPIARFACHYNNLHEWAVSMILCHDKPKARAKQIEKLAEVAIRLRALNNYSGLRAIITAISQATYPGDQPMELFRAKVDLHKRFLSSDILFRINQSHQSYRMALKNTKGPCIPSLEIHISDLLRANEANADKKKDDPLKIHWAKYDMIGKFVASTTEFKQRCRNSDGYKFGENKQISQLLDVPRMDYNMQQSRMAPPDDENTSPYSPYPPVSVNILSGHAKETSVIKRILPW